MADLAGKGLPDVRDMPEWQDTCRNAADRGGTVPLHHSRRPPLLTAAVALLALSLTACGGSDGASTAATATGGVKLIKSGTLTTCTHLPYAPFQFEEGGKTVGFDVDLIDLVAKKLGVTQAIVDTPFEGIKSGQDLNTGKCDIAAAGMTITDERKQVISFSEPYFDATQALLVKTGAGYASLADLKGKTVGVQSGTTGKDYVEAQSTADVKVIEFEDLATEQQGLATGQIDAAVNDLPVWLDYITKNPGKFEVGAEFDTGEQYGYGIKKGGNPKLVAAVNKVLDDAKADGTYDTLYEKWFGQKPSS
jgi:polar amino acid transport system substrate-binding protein